MEKNNSVLYGIFAGIGLLFFYLAIVSLFQSIEFAFLNLRNLWYLIFPLTIGFGTQIGLYSSIKYTAKTTGTIAATGGISAGSMVACCSHFLLGMVPFLGVSGLAVILMEYQSWFLGIGVASNIFGISLMMKHKKQMNKNLSQMKRNIKFPIKLQTPLKGGS